MNRRCVLDAVYHRRRLFFFVWATFCFCVSAFCLTGLGGVEAKEPMEVPLNAGPRAAAGTHTVFSNGYWTLCDNPGWPNAKVTALPRWANRSELGMGDPAIRAGRFNGT